MNLQQHHGAIINNYLEVNIDHSLTDVQLLGDTNCTTTNKMGFVSYVETASVGHTHTHVLVHNTLVCTRVHVHN